MLSVYVFLSLTTYISWKVWVIANRYQKIDRKINHVLVFEIAYSLIMSVLLASASSSFLSIALLTAVIHLLFGFYVELFRPEVRLDNPAHRNALLSFWFFLGADTTITLFSYFLMVGGQ